MTMAESKCIVFYSAETAATPSALATSFVALLARIAVINHGYKGTEVAKTLSLSPLSVSRLVENGENILDNQKHVAVTMADMEL